ncbi:MAG TPA: Uma2 family endonuclease [Polyangiaceae bacterium]|nr:Uma2 family endonuclease [Polyangiaceae bacterium]
MAEAAQRRASYDDVLSSPEHLVAEVVFGTLYQTPRPATGHVLAASAIGEELGPPFKRGRGGPGGWMILDEPELHLGEHIIVPDLAGWRRERMPVMTTAEAYFSLAPDWVCEVVSPSTGAKDRARKLPIYARESVRHVWLVDPLQRTLDVLRLQDRNWVIVAVHEGGAKVRAEPFDAIELDLGILWADVDLGTAPTR